jgi:hypothetical protein
VTAPGSIMVASTRPNSIFRPGNRKYANPKATAELDSATKPAAKMAISRLVPNQESSGSSSQTWT